MITITPFNINSNGYQPDFYLHGNIVKTNDKVCILDDTFKARIHTHYFNGKPLPFSIIEIPEGIHLCEYGNIVCILFTWKVTVHTNDGIIGNSESCYQFDTWIKQNGLIVAVNDKEAIEDALLKYNNKTFMI